MAEGPRQRHAYERYLAMDEGRSIERLHAALAEAGKAPSLRTLYEWSRKYHWQQRIADFERRQREATEAAFATAHREMQERHAKELLLMQQRAMEKFASGDGQEMSWSEAARTAAEAIRLERLLRGEATERTEVTQHGAPRLAELSDEELERLIGLAEDVRREKPARSR